VTAGLVDIVALNYVGMREFLQDFYFVIEHFEIRLVVLLELDDFHCALGIVFTGTPTIDLAAIARSDLFCDVVEVMTHFFLSFT